MAELQTMLSGKLGGKNSSICQPNAMTHRPGKLGGDLLEPFLWSLTGYTLGSGTLIG